MQNLTSWLLFIVFALVLIFMYVAIRRHWLSTTLVAAIGVLLSIIVMTLVGISQGNSIPQSLFVGFVVGGLFSVGTLSMAIYFLRVESRSR